jgi:crotonobetainyl-CoA:carnitine CoA-transferase CaiB-like acyl-CoA transferase
MDRLGLGAEEVLKLNPRLTVATISAFGQTGPHRSYMGYGPLVHAVGGLSAQTGFAEDGIPRDIGMAYGDPNGGVFAAIALAAALWARQRHGEAGQVVDVSMWEAMISSAFLGWMNHALGNAPFQMMGNRDPFWAPHNVYRCAGEDEWIAIACTEDSHWQALCDAMGDPVVANDARWCTPEGRKSHEEALDARIGEWCQARDRWELQALLHKAGVPASIPFSNEELMDDPHLNARGFFTEWPHPEVGVRKMVGAPWHFARRPNGQGHAAPQLGQHTDEVLEQVLRIPADERARLRESGVIE